MIYLSADGTLMQVTGVDRLRDITVTATVAEHIESFHQALDLVARERRYLTMMEAFPLPDTRRFVLDMIKQGNPHFVATVEDQVVGWCDISRHFFPAHAHRGSLAMGIIPDYRGKGVGRRLMMAALDQARAAGFIRIELSVHAERAAPDIRLGSDFYSQVGFVWTDFPVR